MEKPTYHVIRSTGENTEYVQDWVRNIVNHYPASKEFNGSLEEAKQWLDGRVAKDEEEELAQRLRQALPPVDEHVEEEEERMEEEEEQKQMVEEEEMVEEKEAIGSFSPSPAREEDPSEELPAALSPGPTMNDDFCDQPWREPIFENPDWNDGPGRSYSREMSLEQKKSRSPSPSDAPQISPESPAEQNIEPTLPSDSDTSTDPVVEVPRSLAQLFGHSSSVTSEEVKDSAPKPEKKQKTSKKKKKKVSEDSESSTSALPAEVQKDQAPESEAPEVTTGTLAAALEAIGGISNASIQIPVEFLQTEPQGPIYPHTINRERSPKNHEKKEEEEEDLNISGVPVNSTTSGMTPELQKEESPKKKPQSAFLESSDEDDSDSDYSDFEEESKRAPQQMLRTRIDDSDVSDADFLEDKSEDPCASTTEKKKQKIIASTSSEKDSDGEESDEVTPGNDQLQRDPTPQPIPRIDHSDDETEDSDGEDSDEDSKKARSVTPGIGHELPRDPSPEMSGIDDSDDEDSDAEEPCSSMSMKKPKTKASGDSKKKNKKPVQRSQKLKASKGAQTAGNPNSSIEDEFNTTWAGRKSRRIVKLSPDSSDDEPDSRKSDKKDEDYCDYRVGAKKTKKSVTGTPRKMKTPKATSRAAAQASGAVGPQASASGVQAPASAPVVQEQKKRGRPRKNPQVSGIQAPGASVSGTQVQAFGAQAADLHAQNSGPSTSGTLSDTKPGRGRPKGSKNGTGKKYVKTGKKRGRPPKNQKKEEEEMEMDLNDDSDFNPYGEGTSAGPVKKRTKKE